MRWSIEFSVDLLIPWHPSPTDHSMTILQYLKAKPDCVERKHIGTKLYWYDESTGQYTWYDTCIGLYTSMDRLGENV